MSHKRIIALVSAFVLVAAGSVAGTYAAFSAKTTNAGNTFATGTLVLSSTKSGTTCYSTGGGATDANSNTGCASVAALTLSKPGDATTGRVTLKNEGSLASSKLGLNATSCTTANAAGETYHGTGDLCAALQVYVQAYTDATYTTKSSCLFGGGTATVCAYDPSKTAAALATTYTAGSPADLGPLAAGTSKFVEVGVQIPSTADNTIQGRTASFDLAWSLAQ